MSELIELEKRISGIEATLKQIESVVSAFKIDKQRLMKTDNNIIPGIGVKVSYDMYGRITGSTPLEQNDIPQLSVEKINGLSGLLEDKATKSDINSLSNKIDSVNRHSRTVKTGTVVNVDENGLVNDVSDLTPENIPELPIDKIKDLPEVLDQLRLHENTSNNIFIHKSITAGVACKVSYDEYGHITGSERLVMEDLPSSIDARLNRIESKLADVALRTDLNELSVALNKKMDIPSTKLIPGIYTKLAVSENGLISGVNNLSSNDIPELPITSIHDLSNQLSSKASLNNMEELSNTLQTRIHDMENKEQELPPIPSMEEFIQLKHSHEELLTLVNTLLSAIPGDQILQEIDSMKEDLSTISGRLSVVEMKNKE